jgi:hypothetical protein
LFLVVFVFRALSTTLLFAFRFFAFHTHEFFVWNVFFEKQGVPQDPKKESLKLKQQVRPIMMDLICSACFAQIFGSNLRSEQFLLKFDCTARGRVANQP